jgi:hypothetical protein
MLQPRLLDLPYLTTDEAQALRVAAQVIAPAFLHGGRTRWWSAAIYIIDFLFALFGGKRAAPNTGLRRARERWED